MKNINPNIVIVTGLSGAGKSQALRTLEDFGYFCVDNLPPRLISTFVGLCSRLEEPICRVAMGVDIRGGEFFEDLSSVLETLAEDGAAPLVLFLEATDEVLMRRYKETRRRHPLSPQGAAVAEGIHVERAMLSDLKSKANLIVDTSGLTPADLKRHLVGVFSRSINLDRLLVTIVTFGYKHGLPKEADLVMDVRFLPNPYYLDELKTLSGLDKEVSQYVLRSPLTKRFLPRFTRFMDFLLACYVEEGRNHLTVAIGCTGGRHRSVAIGESLRSHLEGTEYAVVVEHRDIERGETGGLGR